MATVSLKVLSGGAVQRGLESAANIFEKDTGHKIDIMFATAPAIRRKMESEESSPDVVLAPVPAIDELTKSGHVSAGSSAMIGCVKAGVVVRQGVPEPDISSSQSFKQEILDSHSLVYNEGSSGIFVEKLLEQLGVAEQAKAKTIRYPDAEGVMKHLAAGRTSKEIGFGQITAILLHAGRGLKLVGPLPREIENITTYAAGVSTRAQAPEVAQQFVRFLVKPPAREAFKAGGVDEPARR
ncbi:MAG: substrate-binding domain-containing protein [Candidatus Binatia bacterium]